MRYTKHQFDQEYSTEDACLEAIFQRRYGDVDTCPSCGVIGTKFYRVSGRKCYACEWCGYQRHPLAGTIFHKSSTPLKSWLYAIYLFSVSKNGVAAKELERHLGVTYKTAHRMARQIRSLMDETGKIGGTGSIIEADETYYGKRAPKKGPRPDKSAVLGVVERGGAIRTKVVPKSTGETIHRFLYDSVDPSSELYTDESPLYTWTGKVMIHETITHAKGEYARGSVSTNTIEGFWGQVKRSISGTYHFVSPKYLQLYVAEFAWRYSHRDVAAYPLLLELAAQRVSAVR